MPSNRLREALKENVNLVSLTTSVALSFALGNPIPLLVGLVAEAAYLLIVPDSRWYTQRLSKRFDAEVEQRRQQLKERTLPTLNAVMQARFGRLEETRRQIETQAQDEATWFREVLRKLDYLLDKFLMFAAKEAQFRDYLMSVRGEEKGAGRTVRVGYDDYDLPSHDRRASRNNRPPQGKRQQFPQDIPFVDSSDEWTQRIVREVVERFEKDLSEIEERLETEQEPANRAILEKRADVMKRRQEHVGRIGKILVNLHQQLQLVEDTFGLINDEIRARSPEQVLEDIEEVVQTTDSMTKALEEITSFEQLTTRIG